MGKMCISIWNFRFGANAFENCLYISKLLQGLRESDYQLHAHLALDPLVNKPCKCRLLTFYARLTFWYDKSTNIDPN